MGGEDARTRSPDAKPGPRCTSTHRGVSGLGRVVWRGQVVGHQLRFSSTAGSPRSLLPVVLEIFRCQGRPYPSCARRGMAYPGSPHQEGQVVGQQPGGCAARRMVPEKIELHPMPGGSSMKTGALRIGPETREPLSPWGGGGSPDLDSPSNWRGRRRGPGRASRTNPQGRPPRLLQPGFYFTRRSFTLNACISDGFSVFVFAISARSWWKMPSCRSMVVSRVRR